MQLLPSGCWIRLLRQLKVTGRLIRVLSEIERFFPQLAETDLLEFIQLQGRTETSERFYANEVLSR